ncbi:cutinase domain-containing protein [Sarocladium implicatum]|nr:cutinase domain-containing protein [Sarocladium implicatum]
MHFLTLLTFVSAAVAGPLQTRQSRVGINSNEFTRGGCRDIIMIWARGSTEVGNMGTVVGPPTGNALKQKYGADRVAVEGVPYGALISTNALPGGTDSRSAGQMRTLIEQAASQCPDSALVVGGYSQGAAVTHRAVENLPQETKDKIAAAFMYGDTQNTQDRGQIKGFDPAKTNIICNTGDAVCTGLLVVLPAHLDYTRRVPAMATFLESALTAAGVTA